MARNFIETIDLSIVMRELPCLERLDLSQNIIVSLLPEPEMNMEETLVTNTSLKRLLLSRNLLKDFRPAARLHLPGLEVLTLFGNYIDIETEDR